MILLITNQAYLFLIFTLNGIIIGLLFDFFRILRRSFKTSDFITYIEDTLFWVLTGFLILYSIFVFNNGEIRLFMFLGIIIGVALYMLLLSKHIIKINVYIISVLKKVFVTIGKIVFYPISIIMSFIRKIFIRPITFLFINFRNFTKNLKNMTNKVKISKNHPKKEGI